MARGLPGGRDRRGRGSRRRPPGAESPQGRGIHSAHCDHSGIGAKYGCRTSDSRGKQAPSSIYAGVNLLLATSPCRVSALTIGIPVTSGQINIMRAPIFSRCCAKTGARCQHYQSPHRCLPTPGTRFASGDCVRAWLGCWPTSGCVIVGSPRPQGPKGQGPGSGKISEAT